MAAAFPPPHLSSEASSSFVSIGRARSTALSVDFSFVNRSVHYFLQWRPVVALAIVDHRPISWEWAENRVLWPSKIPLPFLVLFPISLSFSLSLSSFLAFIQYFRKFRTECSTRSHERERIVKRLCRISALLTRIAGLLETIYSKQSTQELPTTKLRNKISVRDIKLKRNRKAYASFYLHILRRIIWNLWKYTLFYI